MSIKDLEVHKSDGVHKQDPADSNLYEILERLPDPPKQSGLNDDQKFWWYWFGKEFISTKQITKLDLAHLQKAAFWMASRCDAIKVVNARGYFGGIVQTYATGAQNISPHLTVIEKADKALDDVSAHFGLSLKDRKKLNVANKDPDQLDLFNAFLLKKTV
jgi:phage terminase small subunit